MRGLRERRFEAVVGGHVDDCRAVVARGLHHGVERAGAHDHRGDVTRAERRGLRQHAERALGGRVACVFEEHEHAHTSSLATR